MMIKKEQKQKIKNELVFKRLEEDDLPSVSNLISGMSKDTKESFWLRSKAPDYYRWMYFLNPAGKSSVFCATHHNKVISTFALTPKKVQINNQIILGGKTMDMFTHPDYQGMGLMTKLGNMVFNDAKKKGMEFWYVTPSGNSYPIFLKKWHYIENFELVYLVKIINPGVIANAYLKNRFLGDLVKNILTGLQNALRAIIPSSINYGIEVLDCFDDETDRLWEESRQSYTVSLVRDSAYMNWRYFENPDEYKVIGFKENGLLCGLVVLKITLRKGINIGEIADFIFLPDKHDMLQAIITSAINEFYQNHCAVLQNWVFEKSWMETEMRKAGIRFKRKRLKFLLSPGSEHKEIYDKNKWFFTQGDGNDI